MSTPDVIDVIDVIDVTDVIVVMGVAGTGKTTIGPLVAEALGVPYAEGDDFHPTPNIAKMSAGIPLDDADRGPWLDAIGAWAHERGGRGGVVSSSALKRAYRDRLRAAAPGIVFLHLTGARALIEERMAERRGHFMPQCAAGLPVRHARTARARRGRLSSWMWPATPAEIAGRAVAALHARDAAGAR